MYHVRASFYLIILLNLLLFLPTFRRIKNKFFYRYSRMDSEEMLRKSTDGQYWTNSSFALVSTLMHSTDMWHLSNLIEPSKQFVDTTPFLSETIRAKLQVSAALCCNWLMKLRDSKFLG